MLVFGVNSGVNNFLNVADLIPGVLIKAFTCTISVSGERSSLFFPKVKISFIAGLIISL
jgi:hypothetical protein